MSLTTKRSINIQVVVNASFKKKYILLISKLISQLDIKLESYKKIQLAKGKPELFRSYIAQKFNEILLQKEQMLQQVDAIKRCNDGHSFLLTTIEGQQSLSQGQDLMDIIAPAIDDKDSINNLFFDIGGLIDKQILLSTVSELVKPKAPDGKRWHRRAQRSSCRRRRAPSRAWKRAVATRAGGCRCSARRHSP